MVQEYKIVLKRDTNGVWWLTGFWNTAHKDERAQWDLDGHPLMFKTRREAVDHLAQKVGIPE